MGEIEEIASVTSGRGWTTTEEEGDGAQVCNACLP